MRAHAIGTGVLFGLATAMLSAPVALAAPVPHLMTATSGAEVFITADGSPQAGEDIEVVVRCQGEVGAPASPVLHIGELDRIDAPADTPTYVAPATIDADAAPGNYPLTALCDGDTLSNTITIVASGADNDEGDKGDATGHSDAEQVTRTPRGAPETGDDPENGPSPLLLGAVGLAGIGALTVRWVVRR